MPQLRVELNIKIFTVYTNYAQCSAVASVLGVVRIFGAAN